LYLGQSRQIFCVYRPDGSEAIPAPQLWEFLAGAIQGDGIASFCQGNQSVFQGLIFECGNGGFQHDFFLGPGHVLAMRQQGAWQADQRGRGTGDFVQRHFLRGAQQAFAEACVVVGRALMQSGGAAKMEFISKNL
jgi:hypothetical protein